MHAVGKRLCHPLIPLLARTQPRSLIKRTFNRFNESSRHHFDSLLVLDFEATCDSKRGTIQPQVNFYNIVLFYCPKEILYLNLKPISGDYWVPCPQCGDKRFWDSGHISLLCQTRNPPYLDTVLHQPHRDYPGWELPTNVLLIRRAISWLISLFLLRAQRIWLKM